MTARLFWKLPEPFHTLLAVISGGWRVVRRQDPQLISLDQYRWERWPNDVIPANRKPWA